MHVCKRVVALTAVALLPLSAALSIMPATQASAGPNNPRVRVVGQAQICKPGTIVHRVLIQTANGEATDDYVAGKPGALFGIYSLALNRVPKRGERAQIYVFCTNWGGKESSYGKTVTISRPPVGTLFHLSLKP